MMPMGHRPDKDAKSAVNSYEQPLAPVAESGRAGVVGQPAAPLPPVKPAATSAAQQTKNAVQERMAQRRKTPPAAGPTASQSQPSP